MTTRRLFITLALALALAIAVPLGKWRPGSAGAQTSGAQIMLDPTSFGAGSLTSLAVSGSGFAPNEDLTVSYIALEGGNPTQEQVTPDPVTDSGGSFTGNSLPVPSDIDPGSYTVYALGVSTSSPDYAYVTFEVTAPAGSTDTPTAVTSVTPSDTPTNTPTVGPSGTVTATATSVGTATATATVIPGSTATATTIAGSTSTSTPVPSPTNTAAAVPTNTATPSTTGTATPAPTDTSTSVPAAQVKFIVEAAKIGYGSSNPAKVFTKTSLSHVKVGEKVKLILYAKLTGLAASESVTIGFRVTSAGKTDLLARGNQTVAPSENGQNLFWSHFFTPSKKGAYTFAGTLFVGSHHRHKTVSFAVG
jgi:hypothetical protein